jgi:hypothetical protein
MLVFGFLFLTISSGVVDVIFGYTDPNAQLELALAAIIIASVGAGLLMHGLLSKQTEEDEEPEAEPQQAP